MTTNQLATTQPTAIVAQEISPFALSPLEYVEGTQELTREDLQIPQLVLVQAQHTDIPENLTHLGQWYNTVTNEFSAEVHAVLLSEGKGRAAFARKFSRESEPLCASADAIMPRSEHIGTLVYDPDAHIEHTIDEQGCSQCPFSQFVDTENGETITPLCAKAYSYAMVDSGNGIPFVLRVQRSGSQAGKQLNTVAKLQGRRNMIRITSRKVDSDSGAYYVPVFSTNGKTTQEMIEYAYKMSIEFGNIAKRGEAIGTGNTSEVEQIELK